MKVHNFVWRWIIIPCHFGGPLAYVYIDMFDVYLCDFLGEGLLDRAEAPLSSSSGVNGDLLAHSDVQGQSSHGSTTQQKSSGSSAAHHSPGRWLGGTTADFGKLDDTPTVTEQFDCTAAVAW